MGRLYIVATPIGHLDDISARAAKVLKSVQIIAAEDTRRSGILLKKLGAERATLIALHEHNEEARVASLIEKLKAGDDIAVVSDAGTPLISDPGFRFVRSAWDSGVKVVPIPGCSAVMAAVSICPLPVDRFFFEGFLPAKSAARVKRLQQLSSMGAALIFFESPRRIQATLEDLIEVVGTERRILVARELTKIHETALCGSLEHIRLVIGEDAPRGEFVCILEAAPEKDAEDAEALALMKILSSELKPSQAARLAAKYTGISKSRLYDFVKN
ncbi:MAG: 16S rRNA (cytidine(1402)-2'-O)-methyltransferase [Pseudomonadales bacterium]|nr:16S rRNA (cytidine(1402)-2'-O)-methyltransferase [Pseudomonadales bacterium]